MLTDSLDSQQLHRDGSRISLADDAENGSEASTAPAVPVIPDPNMPLAVYRAPSFLPSEAMSSSGGPSLIPPTLTTSDNVPIPQPARSVEWPELPLHLEVDDKIRNAPFEIEAEGLSLSSATVVVGGEENPCLFPWRFEFRWEGGVLHSSSGSLESALVYFARQSIRISAATAGGSDGFSEPTHVSTVRVARSDVSLHTAVWLEDEGYWAMKRRRGELLRILIDHYLKTHTSQGTNRRNRVAGRGFAGFPRSAPDTTTTSVRPSTVGGSSRRLVSGGGSGGGEDDDPGDGDDDRSRHGEGPVLSPVRHFACPFQKWRPQLFKQCFYRHVHVWNVKQHVRKKHYVLRCPECHKTVETPQGLEAHKKDTGCGARPTPNTRPGIISEEQLAMMSRRPYKRTVEQQWRDLFTILFPNEPQPRDVYVDREADEKMQHIAHHYDTCCIRLLHLHQAEQARDDPFFSQFDTPEAQRQAVTEQFVPSMMLELDGQATSDWSPPFALSEARNDASDTVSMGSSLFPSNYNQNQSLAHDFPHTLDSSLRQNYSETSRLYNLQALEHTRVPPPLPAWNLGLQFSIQPTNLSDANHTALDCQPMTTHVPMEQQAPVVPQQLGLDFGAQLHHLPNEDLFSIRPQCMFQPDPHSNNNNNARMNQAIQPPVVSQLGVDFDAQLHHLPHEDLFAVGPQYMFQSGPYSHSNHGSVNPATSIGSSTIVGPPSLPGTHGFAPMAMASSGVYESMPTNDAHDNATMAALAPSCRRHKQWADMGPKALSHFDSLYVAYQDIWPHT